MKGANTMFFRFVLLGISFVVVMLLMEVVLPKIKLKHRLHKELKESIFSAQRNTAVVKLIRA